ncbi:replication protein A 70 kDa DNA-binding subunit [Striga asiatica]|uniref:Replication protein A subunit n=1 Tax=Striga asiatica TaxID=4170 RepID=A0A5A7RK49_STRAF|nr:replication protein A 70 kDa DNA-binding subunit [Striga asiatica]
MEPSDTSNMPPVNLTEGAIPMLSNGQAQEANFKPVVQVTSVRLINTQNQINNAVERYRVVLSDGTFSQQSMLGTQCNDLVRSQRLQTGSIIQLMQYVCNVIQNKRIIIVVDLELIVEKCDLIGDPVQYPTDGSAPSAVRPPTLRPTMNQPSGGNSPPYSAVTAMSSSVPRSTTGGGVNVPLSDRNSGPYSYSGGSFSGNSRTEAVSGMSRPAASNFGRTPHSYQQPPPMYSNRGPVAKNEAPARIIPIAALNPYQGRWTIKARVTAKSDLRLYNNAKGDGKVFSFDLLDSDGGEIRATCFNAVADQFYGQIEPGRVYMVSRGTLKPAQKAYNHLRNDHEITLDNFSTVQACFDDDNSIPQQQFHFRPISDIEVLDNTSVVDVIGIVSSVGPSSSIMRKNGTETVKRTLQLKDMSGRSVELTLWGNFCNAEGRTLQEMCDSGVFPVLAVKASRVNDFNGKSVGTISTSQLFIEPDFPEAHKLKAWFNNEGKGTPSISISGESSMVRTDTRKTISQIKDEKLGTSEKPDWIIVSATLTYIKADNFCYTACPLMIADRQCSKKVTNNGDGKWRCERCEKSVEECDYRYILQMQIQDHTGLTWATAFQETGKDIMGISAKDLYYIKYEEQDEEKFIEVMRNALFNKFLFKLKVKEEFFSDEQRVKSTVVKAEKVNFETETRYLLDSIANMKEDGSSVITTPGATGRSHSGGFNSNVGASQLSPHGNNNTSTTNNNNNNNDSEYGGGYMSCNKCGGTGHITGNCPSLVSGSGECYKCHKMGHWARDCPGTGNSGQSGYGGSNMNPGAIGASGECYKCHKVGHWARDCPGMGNTGESAYGGSNAGPGRYGMVSKQHVGGF